MDTGESERRSTYCRQRRWASRALAGLLAMATWAAPARAQFSHTGEEVFTNKNSMSIPFKQDAPGRVKQMQLYVSADFGRTWQFHANAAPTERFFKQYLAPVDGTYWFGVRTIDTNDQATPATLDGIAPGLKVVVDRKPPIITLRQSTNPQPGTVGVEWDVREEHLDPARFVMEYRVPGRTDWIAQPIDARVTGAQMWRWDATGRMDVRLRVTDKAGNEAEQSVSFGAGATGVSNPGNEPRNGDPNSPAANPGQPRILHVNSPVLASAHRVKDVGVSKLSVFELWFTRDRGNRWERAPKGNDPTLPENPGDLAEGLNKKIQFDTNKREGLYGFTFVARSGVGLGDPDPKPGDQPRIWVEVDLTPPKVEMNAKRGQGTDVRNVTIQWSATDKNLAERPVTLLYSEDKNGTDWTPIVSDLDKSGVYTWTITDRGPFKFYIQCKAIDKAGNVGSYILPEQLVVDLSHPKVDIIDVEPVTEQRPR